MKYLPYITMAINLVTLILTIIYIKRLKAKEARINSELLNFRTEMHIRNMVTNSKFMTMSKLIERAVRLFKKEL